MELFKDLKESGEKKAPKEKKLSEDEIWIIDKVLKNVCNCLDIPEDVGWHIIMDTEKDIIYNGKMSKADFNTKLLVNTFRSIPRDFSK